MAFIPPGLQTFTGTNGVAAALGTVAFYIPGTTTPKDTWSDSALTVKNTNPVALDAGGRAAVWGSGAYRQVVKDAAGDTVWDTIVSTLGTVNGAIVGNQANVFQITHADAGNALNVDTVVPRPSTAGTRTTEAPRVTGGNGTDLGFDSFITSNCVATATGTPLFRDEFQDTSTFNSLSGAHASYDARCDFQGVGDRNHQRDFQARGQLSLTSDGSGSGTSGLSLLSERTGYIFQPLFNGNWQIGQLAGVWIRDAQIVSGSPSVVTAYGILVDTLTQGSGNIYGLYLAGNDAFFGKSIQGTSTYSVFGFKEYKGLAGNFTGGYTSFDAGGGLLCAGNATASGYAAIRAYADGSGSIRGLNLVTNNLVVAPTGADPVTGKQLEVQGSASATTYFVGASQVVGARDTGWTPMTGTGSKAALAAAAAGTASGSYVQTELQGALNRIAALEARLKSYDAALVAHGLIGA